MILEGKSTHVAYRCPGCGFSIFGFVGAFSKTHDLLKLKCQCGESEMSMNFSPDGIVRLSVPCLFCRQNHRFSVSENLFFGRDLFLLNCPYTNMDICFIGHKEKIDQALENSAEELNRLFEEADIDEAEQSEGPSPEDVLPDAQVYDILRFVVKELEADGRIECPCRSGPYEMDISSDGIRVFCTHCGASYLFPCDSLEQAKRFLDCDELTLAFEP